MSNDGDSAHQTAELLDGEPAADSVRSRAEGRPPEEQASEAPEAQAEAILQESEDRMSDGADGSEPMAE
jgi:hypothetical protein